MKVNDLFEASSATSPSGVRDSIIKALKELGYSVHSKSSTPGATKAWINKPRAPAKPMPLKQLAAFLAEKLPALNVKYSPPPYSGGEARVLFKGGELSGDYDEDFPSSRGNLFIATYRSGRAGYEYASGIDA